MRTKILHSLLRGTRSLSNMNLNLIIFRFITALDCLRLETRDVDNLFPNISDLYSAINAMSSLPADFNGRIKVKKW